MIKYLVFGILTCGIVGFITKTYKKKPYITISIEGNIGAGKTTILNIMKEHYPTLTIVKEPVNTWLNIKNNEGQNILQVFYNNKKRWAYIFQNLAYLTRLKILVNTIKKVCEINIFKLFWYKLTNNKIIIVTERSINTDRNVFAQMLYDTKFISDIEYNIYHEWYYYFDNTIQIDGIIYLKNTPQCSFYRIHKRGRIEETNIELSYLEELHKYHKKWFDKEQDNVLSLDVNEEFEGDSEKSKKILQEHMKLIASFIKSISN